MLLWSNMSPYGAPTQWWRVARDHIDSSGLYQLRRVFMMHEWSTSELLSRAIICIQQDDKEHSALNHHAALKGLNISNVKVSFLPHYIHYTDTGGHNWLSGSGRYRRHPRRGHPPYIMAAIRWGRCIYPGKLRNKYWTEEDRIWHSSQDTKNALNITGLASVGSSCGVLYRPSSLCNLSCMNTHPHPARPTQKIFRLQNLVNSDEPS